VHHLCPAAVRLFYESERGERGGEAGAVVDYLRMHEQHVAREAFVALAQHAHIEAASGAEVAVVADGGAGVNVDVGDAEG